MSTQKQPTKVIYRYPHVKGMFLHDPDWRPGGAPVAVYTLSTQLATYPQFDVYAWVEGDVPPGPVEGVTLVSDDSCEGPVFDAVGAGIYVFTVIDQDYFPQAVERIHALGGKVVYRVASDRDVMPQLRGSEGGDDFSQALRQCDAIFAQTEFQAQHIEKNFGIQAHIIAPSFRAIESHAQQREGVLWVGQSLAIKRPWVVLELARALPDERFTMIMPSVDAKLYEVIVAQAATLSNVEIVPFVSFDAIQPYFDRAKVVLNTSLYEGYPNTLHQANISGTPYLSLKWSPDSFFTRNDAGGVYCDNSVDVLLDRLKRLLSDATQADSLGKQGNTYFKQNHDVATVITDHIAVYEGLCNEAD